MPQICLSLKISPSGTVNLHLLIGKHVEGFAELKLLVGLLKTCTKICLDVTSNDNVRFKNSKTLSVGQDIVNCIFLD